MKNIVGEVWKILDKNPSIRRDLALGIINNRALAKYIIKEHKLNATLDAVISAIRRYEIGRHDDVFVIAQKLLCQTVSLSTRNGLAEVSLIKDNEVQQLLPEIFEIIQFVRGETLRIIQATESIRLLIDEKNLDKIKEIFPRNKIIKIDRDIAEINIRMHPDMRTTYGILAVIANELALNGISIMEIMSCFPEMLIFVEEKNILKAYQVLHQLCYPTI
ncbi:MAG: ACT domain-containing protein [Candidatus Thermoplasmatota archaeon]|jgi:aspartokinase|nr:ACT domain-containing protein [Candidatus Thermoplasmatota archaeon]